MVTSEAKHLPKNYFWLKSYLKELVSEERYEYFKNKTSIKELTWEGLPVKQQIAIIMDYMLEPKILEKALIYAPEVSYKVILKLLNKTPLEREEIYQGEMYLYENFLINNKGNFLKVERDQEELDEFFIYEDLLPIILSFNLTKIEAKRKEVQPFISYITPCLNFYGMLEIDNLMKIYRAQNIDSLPDETLKKNLKSYRYFCVDLVIKDDQIMQRAVLEDYRILHQGIKGKPLYIPAKAELLKYGGMYMELSPQLINLVHFMVHDLKIEEDVALRTISLVISEIHFGTNPFDVISLQLNTKDLKIINQYAQLWIEFHNNFRSWFNRGHTPNELARDFPNPGNNSTSEPKEKKNNRKTDPNQHIFDFADNKADDEYDEFDDDEQVQPIISNTSKISRNDPCPCGSGKKFKKCCGKVEQ